jgi:hypothetical protein
MSAHTPSTTYAQQIADGNAAQATYAAAVASAQTTLNTALASAPAYKPNDAGAWENAVAAAYKAYNTSVAAAAATLGIAAETSQAQQKNALKLPL